MSSPLSFSEAGDLARTHTSDHSDDAAFAARSPAQLILDNPSFARHSKPNLISINRLTQLAS
jgi:hypothetical protein